MSVNAVASDNVGVAGLQFLLNGNNLGPEDTTTPYAVSWDTTTATNGVYTLAARVRDAAGNANGLPRGARPSRSTTTALPPRCP